jgi:hypothetical protein
LRAAATSPVATRVLSRTLWETSPVLTDSSAGRALKA